MRIERRKVDLVFPLNLDQIRTDRGILGLRSGLPFSLNHTQYEFLTLLSRRFSIFEIVTHYHSQRLSISYQGLAQLMEFLVKEAYINEPHFCEHFSQVWKEPKGLIGGLLDKVFGAAEAPIKVKEEVRALPFFRSLQPGVFKLFLSHAKISETPARIYLCQAGQAQRNLFVVLRGQASVYKTKKDGSRVRVATLTTGSIFGEVGFFLGEPRTADVVTDESSLILQIQYDPTHFDPILNAVNANETQKRFQVIRALQRSSIFRGLPDDCFDELVFAGELRTLPAKQLVCKEGESGSTCYVIAQGSVSVSKDGKKISRLGSGDCFGEIALLSRERKRTASVETETEVLALEISDQEFYKLLAENLLLACEFERLAEARAQVRTRCVSME